MEQTGGIPFQQIVIYIVLLSILFLFFLGFKKLWVGLREKEKWAKVTAIVLTLLLIITIILGIAFSIYALALGEAFNH